MSRCDLPGGTAVEVTRGGGDGVEIFGEDNLLDSSVDLVQTVKKYVAN